MLFSTTACVVSRILRFALGFILLKKLLFNFVWESGTLTQPATSARCTPLIWKHSIRKSVKLTKICRNEVFSCAINSPRLMVDFCNCNCNCNNSCKLSYGHNIETEPANWHDYISTKFNTVLHGDRKPKRKSKIKPGSFYATVPKVNRSWREDSRTRDRWWR